VAYLAKTVPLSPAVLRTRYKRELRPIIIGDQKKHDRTLEMWIEAYFHGRSGLAAWKKRLDLIRDLENEGRR